MEKINILVLEDDEIRIWEFKERFLSLFKNKKDNEFEICYAKTANEAINFLKETTHFNIIFLDHDLGNRIYVPTTDENTGSEVIRFLLKHANEYANTIFVIHSFNTVAAESMLNNIRENITNNVIYVPGIWTFSIFKKYIRIK